MPITLNGTSGITFPNNSVQAAAALPGNQGQVFTSNGTFTIPSGVTAVKVTVVGGGGGGGSGTSNNGSAGGTSSVASGTQSITTISATGGGGGAGGTVSTGIPVGGIGSNGDLNGQGGQGFFRESTPNKGGPGGFSLFGAGGTGSSDGGIAASTGTSRGSGGGGGFWGGGEQGATSGAGGGNAIKYLTSLTPGNTLSVTIGSGGAGGAGSAGQSAGGAGSAGVVIFEW
jgi:hypothetical protein